MRAKFVGDPNDGFSGPRVFPFRGVDFPKGKWVTVADPETFRKCEGNGHFETSDEVAADATEVAAEPADDFAGSEDDDALFNGADPAAFDQDGDGHPGGPVESDEKAALISALEAFPDAQFKRSWGVARLTAALEEARFLAGDDEPATDDVEDAE